MSKPIPVKFIKAWRGYAAGEVAGFTAEQAKVLVESETAVPVDTRSIKDKPAPAAATNTAAAAPVVDDAAADDAAADEKP